MVRKQKALIFGRRFLERRDFIRLSIHFICPFQYLVLKNSSFWTVPKCPSHCLSSRDFFYPQFQDRRAHRRLAAGCGLPQEVPK